MWSVKKKVLFVLYWVFAAGLPQSDHLKFARKFRAFFAKRILAFCGSNVNIERRARFTPDVELGDRSGIGINCEITGPAILGKDIMMGPEVVIYSGGHRFDRTDIPMMDQGFTEKKAVVIGDDVWLGRRVIIMPGVHIGDGCVIGAGAVVTKDIPPYSVAGGVPARVIRSRK